MRYRWFLCIPFFFSGLVSFSQNRLKEKYNNGIINKVSNDSTWNFKMSGRIQLRSATTFNLTNEKDIIDINFLVRRARFKFSGDVLNSKLAYKLELGLSNNDIGGGTILTGSSPRYILDAYVNWRLNKNFSIVFGQTKLPGNRERIISSGKLQFVDRSILNSNFNIDRDIGFIFKHKSKIGKILLTEELAISKGEGRNVVSENLGGLQYSGKVEILPFGVFLNKGDYFGADLEREQTPKVAIALAFNYNDDAVKSRGNMGELLNHDDGFLKADIYTMFADAIFKFNGFSSMIEFTKRDGTLNPLNPNEPSFLNGNQDILQKGIIEKGSALNIQIGQLFDNNWETSLRYSTAKLKEPMNNYIQSQYTLGISKYLVGHDIKLQSDFTLNRHTSTLHDVQIRVQLEIGL